MKSLAAALFLGLAATLAFAEDPAPPRRPKAVEPRKFEPGKLSDPYWGITYEVPGIEEKPGKRLPGRLYEGKLGRVQIEIGVFEHSDQLTAKERRDADKSRWDAKKRPQDEYAQGDDPAPWATFLGEAPNGDKRREGYAWHVRGYRTFVVHSWASATAEGGAEGVKAALGGLKVGPETGAAILIPLVSAEQRELPYDDPEVMRIAAVKYLTEEPVRVEIAEDLLRRAENGVPGSRVDGKPAALFLLHQDFANVLTRLKKFDEAVTWYAKAREQAAKTERPGPDAANVDYNEACLYAQQGKLDQAFALLEKAFANPNIKPVPVAHLEKDTDLADCRKDPRWAGVIEKASAKKN